MTLKTQLTSDLTTFFNTDEFAETASYTAIGEAAVDITVIPTRGNPFQEPYVRGEETATCEIEAMRSEVPNPQHGDIFVFDSETWEFDPMRGIINQDDDTYLIGLVRRD